MENPFRPPSDSSDRNPSTPGLRPAWWWAIACLTLVIALYCAMAFMLHAWLTVSPSTAEAERHAVLAYWFMGGTAVAGLATIGSLVCAVRAHRAWKRIIRR